MKDTTCIHEKLCKHFQEDDKPDHWGYSLKIQNLNKRIQKFESSKGELVGRLELLEAQVKVLKDHSHDHAETMQTTPLLRSGIYFSYNPDYKPVTDEKPLLRRVDRMDDRSIFIYLGVE